MGAEQKAANPPRRSTARRQKDRDKEAGWSVEFEIDSTVRVSEAELLVLETYLGKQLDVLFGGGRSSHNDNIAEVSRPMRKRG